MLYNKNVGDQMNNRGFTLIELIATIVLLTLVMSISGYSIISIINSTKQENYDNLLRNIKDASEEYYMECRFNQSSINCPSITNNKMTFALGNLVTYGFLPGNGTSGNDKLTKLINPNTEEDISDCEITITYSGSKLTITNNSTDTNCPTQEEYNKALN